MGGEEKSNYNSAVASQDEEHVKVAVNIRPSITTELLDGCTDFITVALGEQQDSLGGNSKTVVIGEFMHSCLSPADSNAEETNTLNRNIQNKAVDSNLVKKYDIKIQELEGQLIRSQMLSDMENNEFVDCLDLEDDTLHTRTLQDFPSSGDYKEVKGPGEAEVIEKELEHSSHQDKFDRELQELNKCLERKEAEMTRFATVNTSVLKHHYEKKVHELEKAIDGLKFNLSNMSSASDDRAQRLKKAFVQKLNFLEAQVSELKKKQEAQSQLPRQKQISDYATRRLQEDNHRINIEFQLQPKIKHESEKFRLWKASREKEVLQVLQRKTEEASVATKNLKELLEARKASSRVGNGSCSRIQTSQHLGTVNAVMALKNSLLVGVDSRVSSIIKLEGDVTYTHVDSETHPKAVILVYKPSPVIVTISGLISRCHRLLDYLKAEVEKGMVRVDHIAYIAIEWIHCHRVCNTRDVSQFFITGYDQRTQAWALYWVGDELEYPHSMTIRPGCTYAIGSGAPFALEYLEKWKEQGEHEELETATRLMETALVYCSLKDNSCGGSLKVFHLQMDDVILTYPVNTVMTMVPKIYPDPSDPNMAFFFDLSNLEELNYITIANDLIELGWMNHDEKPPTFLGELRNTGTSVHKCKVFAVYLNRCSSNVLNECCHRLTLAEEGKSVLFYTVKNNERKVLAIPGCFHTFSKAIFVLGKTGTNLAAMKMARTELD